MTMNSKPIVTLVGTAAVGKSTLCHRLSKDLDLPYTGDDDMNNPILSEWYKDRVSWNYWVNLFYHSRRVVQQRLAEINGGILDRSVYDNLIFVELSIEDESDPRNISLLEETQEEIKIILSNMKRPDPFIYLTVSQEEQERRMKIRDRTDEDAIDRTYLRRLENKYEEFFGKDGRYPASHIIDTSDLSLDEVYSKIRALIPA